MLKVILDINSNHAYTIYFSRPDNNNILNSSNEVEVTDYTGVPLPVRPDQPIAIVIKITGLNVTMTTACSWTLHDITNHCVIKQPRFFDMIITEINLTNEFWYLPYGVHSLFVHTDIHLDQKDQNTRILLHYENVTDVQVRLSYIVTSFMLFCQVSIHNKE